mmetsp:Transcript_38187/g.53102  ORF Transcript_38187/g.53102 Transcript_38187/m.53102 type:complete len:441 (-) Transcript_38187:156-1478(-)|eukprot:CAMPEP_0201486328 /NCGR_PEP_ID=MMETSP0151_2-20130828/10388_1 /ASSEMBLY_ACC=CAM_ASM_000257 /TAXON_ID=200890 /ORGANISM="Paramoeba atlantica, Strain 621/1 / CCAP 1560/9" /LENGTH=440 /DNA_ID=CAMNT_0047870901 /DNA_START=71 /DNA_END=1393 /DNA_ORIENTATION=-
MSAEDVPIWMTVPMRATPDQKENHQKKRKEEEKVLVPKFRKNCEEKRLDLSQFGEEQIQNIFLGRFLRARRYQLDDAMVMIQEHIKWREEYEGGIKVLMDPSNHSEGVLQLMRYYPGELHGVDRDGIAVYYEKIGKVDPGSLLKQMTKEEILRFHVYKQESSLNDIINKAVEGDGVYRGRVAVVDLHNLGWKHKEGLNLLRTIIRIDESNYPEVLKRLFIIRAPAVFTGIWKLVKPWLDVRTLAKIEICGYYDFLDALQHEIDISQIPEEYGGQCKCVKGCFDEKRGGIFCGKWDGTIKSLDVGRSDSAEISIDVLSGQIVRYEFETEYYDISFGVFFQQADSSEKSLVIDNAKVNSFERKEEGSYEASENGRLLLLFDNTYSWTRGKTVTYRVWIEAPEGQKVEEEEEKKKSKKNLFRQASPLRKKKDKEKGEEKKDKK